MQGKSTTKLMLAATLLMMFILGVHAEQKSITADKSGSMARSVSVREMMSGVSEIGAILEDRHVVYETETLQSNVLNAIIEAIDPEGGAILTKDQDGGAPDPAPRADLARQRQPARRRYGREPQDAVGDAHKTLQCHPPAFRFDESRGNYRPWVGRDMCGYHYLY